MHLSLGYFQYATETKETNHHKQKDGTTHCIPSRLTSRPQIYSGNLTANNFLKTY